MVELTSKRWLSIPDLWNKFASRSIRGSLVVWVTLLLGAVLLFFAVVLYETNRRLTIERIESELRSFGFSVLANGRFGNRFPTTDGGNRGDRDRHGRDGIERERPISEPGPPGMIPPERSPDEAGREAGNPPLPLIADQFPLEQPERRNDRNGPNPRGGGRNDFPPGEPFPRNGGPPDFDRRGPPERMYFLIRREDTGEIIDRSFDLPEDALAPFPESKLRGPGAIHDPTQSRSVNGRWEVKVFDPSRTRSIVVGRWIQREWDDLQRLLLRTGLIALLSLIIGIAGTWLLARRVLSPLDDISKTVDKLTASTLNQRIDVAPLKTELQALAKVLNATFDRLQAGFERQVRFTSDASHELRTPIAVVLAQTEHALARERSAQEYRQALSACGRSASRMRTLVESLLALARADSGRLQLNCQPIDLLPVVEHAIESIKPKAETSRLKLAAQLTSATVFGDAVFLGQVVTNLLNNAIEYNAPEGMIFVTVTSDTDSARISVVDTGRGMSAEERSHLFERFFRADAARSASGSTGHGLGLAICREIVELHGGKIDVSTELGRGSTFCVVLPLYREEAAKITTEIAADPETSNSQTTSE
ncbi:Sensor protein CzcS precursor [Planctopirus ephydatiae]|uniref:histidine kinase n=1 Tax=Planctopirus ephydatiae TaxID=2528019 RepID=A0A518GK14_9PLAN|nr:ATP-binding protein [Planctopirus ephydatiae]QDV28919.1 Sensor protein CzcS precursor [Planctopirus ephydatiae]